MARFAAGVLALVVVTAADPTQKPTTAPPSLRPTAPSPRPTSSTPQPTDLIRILEQDVQSAPFDLPSNICAAFQVQFEGGSDRKFRVEITERYLRSCSRSRSASRSSSAWHTAAGRRGRIVSRQTTGPRSMARRRRATARNRCSILRQPVSSTSPSAPVMGMGATGPPRRRSPRRRPSSRVQGGRRRSMSINKVSPHKPREEWTFGDGEKWAFGGGGGGVSANAASSAPAVVAMSSGSSSLV